MNKGLYNPKEFKDNCGFGLIAHMEGQPSHNLLETAIESLTCMTHRGGIAADGKTGDGCGLLLQKPDTFLRKEAKTLFSKELDQRYAVAMVFFNQSDEKTNAAQDVIEAALAKQNLNFVGWRVVPTNEDCLGPMAKACLPQMQQAFIEGKGLTEAEFAVQLFIARRNIEIALTGDDEFYICSFSEKVISYKGLMMPVDIDKFYLDLADPALETAICVFHQRFSTNTMPLWPLAQPFRLLAHNGEINTVTGNRNWAKARATKFATDLIPNLDDLQPIVNTTGSDSSSMDNMLELLSLGGMDLFRACRAMVPPAWQNSQTIDPALKAFYEYNSMHMEPWDGPAGIVMTDGRYAVCMLDRNGLRPSRWVITKNGFITLASEIGTHSYKPEDVISKGRVGPGRIVAVDTHTGEFLQTEEIDDKLKSSQPYKAWLKENSIRLTSRFAQSENEFKATLSKSELKTHQKQFQVTFEERDQIFRPLAETGQEAIGSMGDDTPMAVLSQRTRPVTDYFRQQFAQVTNPPIDPLREAVVMSLETCVGSEKNMFTETPEHAKRIVLSSPVLSTRKFNALLEFKDPDFASITLDITYDKHTNLKTAIAAVAAQAINAANDGKVIIVLSDRNISETRLPIPAAMVSGAVHHALIDAGLRCDSNIIVDSGSIRDPHQFAVVLGFGATAVHPYLSYEVINDLAESGEMVGEIRQYYKNYRKGIDKGLFKIMSKMGISTIASYRGSQLFEAIGLNDEIVDLCFKGVTSRIQGAMFKHFDDETRLVAEEAFKARKPIQTGGYLKFMFGGEYHTYNPDVVLSVQKACQTGKKSDWDAFATLVNERPVSTIRDLFSLNSDRQPISIDEVESAESLYKRFDSAAMSLGALSPEAHEALAVAMNELGGRSNSGEGGEDPKRHGTIKRSKIKQIASGRFGVTAEYLMSADVLQIKVAQGAKPGEGGQLPGGKVNKLIATLRYSVPGVTLISPPPHHDIYSIEDLAQLIFDLKQINPDALISVKLVSEPGIGTIAAGVAKAYADLITVSGYDGGTAASPMTSIKHAGSPWELGLAEVQQTLRGNDLRGRVKLQADGGLKTGLDVVKAALLGAESFGFGTAPMVALGCKILRICHLNNCAQGVATQNENLRDNHFVGTVEMVKNYFRGMAQEIREIMAQLGYATMQEMIGQTQLLGIKEGATDKQKCLDLAPMFGSSHVPADKPHVCEVERNNPFDCAQTAEDMINDIMPAIENKTGGEYSYQLTNCDRSIGARVAGQIAKVHGNTGMKDAPVQLNLTGVAGQSIGVWNCDGLNIRLEGDANDYVGKGMGGGKVVVYPPKGSEFKTQDTSILGNTCLYGATGGTLYAAGCAGERFAVRNSGVNAVIEGAGDHCCEYMTGGQVTVLGETGVNFGAGMTGGFAYVLDLKGEFQDKYNRELIDTHRISPENMEAYRHHLMSVLEDYVAETNSAWGSELMNNFEDYVHKFWLVKPKAASLEALLANTRTQTE